jgi:hypothetical protein
MIIYVDTGCDTATVLCEIASTMGNEFAECCAIVEEERIAGESI